jgi:hypothetical protein
MKRILIAILLFVFIFFAATTLVFYVQRDSRPVIACASLDDSIRPREHCLMNPFRDRRPEMLAEEVLRELKNDNPQAILPYRKGSTEERTNHFLERERDYQVTAWRVGERTDAENKVSLMYWVSRKNYLDAPESVFFELEREAGEWKLKTFSAIY